MYWYKTCFNSKFWTPLGQAPVPRLPYISAHDQLKWRSYQWIISISTYPNPNHPSFHTRLLKYFLTGLLCPTLQPSINLCGRQSNHLKLYIRSCYTLFSKYLRVFYLISNKRVSFPLRSPLALHQGHSSILFSFTHFSHSAPTILSSFFLECANLFPI